MLLLEDEPDLAQLVQELLTDEGYEVVWVETTDRLLEEAEYRASCVALIDATSATSFDLWWLGPRLAARGVAPLAFTAHHSARAEFEANPSGYVGVVSKPFDARQFIDLVDSLCLDDLQPAGSS